MALALTAFRKVTIEANRMESGLPENDSRSPVSADSNKKSLVGCLSSWFSHLACSPSALEKYSCHQIFLPADSSRQKSPPSSPTGHACVFMHPIPFQDHAGAFVYSIRSLSPGAGKEGRRVAGAYPGGDGESRAVPIRLGERLRERLGGVLLLLYHHSS
jgi:hypothetical protein